MRFLIRAIAAFTLMTSSGCEVSEPAETSEARQAITQTCANSADCSEFAAEQCLPTQIAGCAQAGTASAHCVCVTPPTPSDPDNPPGDPGSTCWQIHNDCIARCTFEDWLCRNACDRQWARCGF